MINEKLFIIAMIVAVVILAFIPALVILHHIVCGLGLIYLFFRFIL